MPGGEWVGVTGQIPLDNNGKRLGILTLSFIGVVHIVISYRDAVILGQLGQDGVWGACRGRG